MKDTRTIGEKLELFDNALSIRHNKRIPTYSNDYTWCIFDAGYRFSEALSDYSILEKIRRDFHEKYCFDAYQDYAVNRNSYAVGLAIGGTRHIIDDDKDSVYVLDGTLMSPDDYELYGNNIDAFHWSVTTKNLKPEMTYQQLYDGALALAGYLEHTAKMRRIFTEEFQCPVADSDYDAAAGNPVDSLFLSYRGMANFSKDMRRHMDRIEAACDAYFENNIQPLLDTLEKPATRDSACHATGNLLSHTVMNAKQFERLFWKYYQRICDKFAEKEMSIFLYQEGSMIRLADYFRDLPKGLQLIQMEQDNIIEMRKALPNIALSGGISTILLQIGTKEENIDYVKKTIDGVGDGLVLSQDKMTSFKNDGKGENLAAVMDFIRSYEA